MKRKKKKKHIFPEYKKPSMCEGSRRSCLKRTMNVKAPGIIGEILNLTKQSCKNITTSKSYLKRKKRKNIDGYS